jgi:putative hydrolase of the HAD superfamily
MPDCTDRIASADDRAVQAGSYDLAVPITAVLFDFGGVILTSPFEAFAHYEASHDLPHGFLRGLNARNPDDNAWARLERNEVGLDGFAELFEAEAREAGASVRAGDVLALLQGDLRPEMAEAVRRCSERLTTGLLTNNFVGFAAATPNHRFTEVLSHFDAIIESSVVGVRKPDPRFYALACERLAIEPADAVFLDDLGINLKPARAMGMRTIKVGDPDVAISELEAIVGFPLRDESDVRRT